jgi:7-cyano-7-deazaguanine synthase
MSATDAARAVCLVSGGMDSAVVLAHARRLGYEVFALSFDYGQRHRVELAAAERIARAGGARDHRTVRVDLAALGGSSLTADLASDTAVPKDRTDAQIGRGVPNTYVPARNTVFLAVALGWAEILGARDLFVGVNAVDYSGYPDCRPEFLAAFEALARTATAAGADGGARFTVHAPLMQLGKDGIVRLGRELGVDFALTHTCYDPRLRERAGEPPLVVSCGRCDACQLRLAGFAAAGATDPLPYERAGEELHGTHGLAARGGDVAGALAELIDVARALRAPGGCVWDRAQSVKTLAAALVEEAFEVQDALDVAFATGDVRAATEELGDVLFATVLVCQVGAEEGRFDLERAARAAHEKIVRRHPHVFERVNGIDADAALAQWERIKAAERAARGESDTSALAGVPKGLPALQRAARLGAKAMARGFRWPDARGALAKVQEEARELAAAFEADDRVELERELGDVLLATAQLANYCGFDAEAAARGASARFEQRFRAMERELGDSAQGATLDQWMAAWRRAKETAR